MGTLTKDEREALEDVFLSIHHSSKLEKIKNLALLIFSSFNNQNKTKSLKAPKYGTKMKKISYFLLKKGKKKKNLSK